MSWTCFAEEDQIAEQRVRLAAADAQVAAQSAAAGASSPSSSSEALTAAAKRAGRRKMAAQVSLFDLANQKIVEEIREARVDALSPEEARELLLELRKRIL